MRGLPRLALTSYKFLLDVDQHPHSAPFALCRACPAHLGFSLLIVAKADIYGSKLAWDEVAQDGHATLLDLYRRLLEIRRTVPAFTDPRFDTGHARSDDDEGWLVLTRDDALIVVNFGQQAADVELEHPVTRELLSVGQVELGDATLHLGPTSAFVAQVELPTLPTSYTPGG